MGISLVKFDEPTGIGKNNWTYITFRLETNVVGLKYFGRISFLQIRCEIKSQTKINDCFRTKCEFVQVKFSDSISNETIIKETFVGEKMFCRKQGETRGKTFRYPVFTHH